MLETGTGIAQDLSRAALVYERGCTGGDLASCTNLGLMYEAGRGVARDPGRAAELYGAACRRGQAFACDLIDRSSQSAAGATPTYHKPGHVADAESGAPLANAIVDLTDLGVRAISDSLGRLDLGRLPPGRHSLRAERAGYDGIDSELEVPGNSEFIVAMHRTPLDDPSAPGEIVGEVIDAAPGGAELGQVEVAVDGKGSQSTVTDPYGRFALEDVPPGLVRLRFARLGYSPRVATLILQPGGRVQLSARLSTRPIELEPIVVTVRSRYLEQAGFFDRAGSGWGTQFSRSELTMLAPMRLSDVVRRVPGISVRYDIGGRAYAWSNRSTECRLSLYIDGARVSDPNLDLIPPRWLEAAEFYQGAGTPIQYRSDVNGCGVVLIWTRH